MKLTLFTLILALIGTEAFAMNADSIRTDVICEEGYKFLVVWSSQGASPTVTQIYERPTRMINVNQPAMPMKCE
jgi:hypothetical protein